MNRLWDTPEFWARSEADEMLREMPDLDPAAVADSFERTSANYDGEPELSAMIVADLRRRAEVEMRFRPDRIPSLRKLVERARCCTRI